MSNTDEPILILAAAIEKCLLDLSQAVGQAAAVYTNRRQSRELVNPETDTLGGKARQSVTVSSPNQLLTTPEAAKLIGTTASNLRVWRCRGVSGPPWVKIGEATIRYRLSDIQAWIASNTRSPIQSTAEVKSVRRIVQPTAEHRASLGADPKRLFRPNEVAEMLGVTEWCLRNWRHLGTKGPKFIKLGERFIRYRAADVEAWLAARETTPINS